MTKYNTIPNDDEALLAKKQKNFKGLVAGAALAAFVLGSMAATALRAGGGAAPAKVVVSLSKGGAKCSCPIDKTQEYTDLRKCLDDCHGVGAQVSRSDKYDNRELYNPENGGYFVWNFDKDQFCWNAVWDSKEPYEVCYHATIDGDNYKLKNQDSDGHYIVELYDGRYLNFKCLDSSDQLYANC